MLRRGVVAGLAALCLAAAPAGARPPAAPLPVALARALAVPHVRRDESGALAVDLASGGELYAQNADLPLAPASNEKLTVTYAALVELGPWFRFRTTVLGEGYQDGAVWHGDLVLRGGGDPTLSRLGLKRLAAQLKDIGIRRVTGAIVGDESFFDARRICAGWKAGFYLDESPPLSALSVDRGVFRDHVTEDPPLAAAIEFRSILRGRGVGVGGAAVAGRAGLDAFPLAELLSDPLEDVIGLMDRESDNFTAELLVKELGAVAGGGGTTAAGAAVVVQALRDAGVPLGGVRIADGSGLSRLDRLTARALVAILQASWLDPDLHDIVFASLPVAGISGTLDDRLRGARGAVRAKTGTTDIASALSGFVKARYVFAVLQNGHPVSVWWARKAQDRFALALAAH